METLTHRPITHFTFRSKFFEKNFPTELAPYKLSLEKTYPWMAEFRKQCSAGYKTKNMKGLTNLMELYIKEVSTAVKDCYRRPKRAAKLKSDMSDLLFYFHSTYKELKPPVEHFSYLEKMSHLMAMYMDMEIKASRNGNESLKKIESIITSALKLYFDGNPGYLIDSLLKSNLIAKSHWVLGDLILRSVLKDLPDSPLDSILYIRYILIFKLWKEIMQESKDEQMRIVELSQERLHPPPGLKEKLEIELIQLNDLFPTLPQTDITKFLMNAKFSSKDKAKIFFKALANPIVVTCLAYPTYSLSTAFNDPTESSLFEKNVNVNAFDRHLNEVWVNMWSKSKVNMNSLDRSSPLLRNSKYKCCKSLVKIEELGQDDLYKEDDISLGLDDKQSLKLEFDEEDLIQTTNESLCRYIRSLSDKMDKDVSWKSEMEKDLHIKDGRPEELDNSKSCEKFDLEDEIMGSSNEDIFDLQNLIDPSVAKGEKVENSEQPSSLPFKKRKRVSFRKCVKKSKAGPSEMKQKQFSKNYSLSRSLDIENSSTNNLNLLYNGVTNFCDSYKACNSTLLQERNCEQCNGSECLNPEECNVPPPYMTIVSAEDEGRKVFKTPAQLKAFHNSLYESPGLINLALYSDYPYESEMHPESRGEADVLSKYSHLVDKQSKPRRGKKRGTGRPRKNKTPAKVEKKNKVEADVLSKYSHLVNKQSAPKNGKKRGIGRPRKTKTPEKVEETTALLDELTETAAFFK